MATDNYNKYAIGLESPAIGGFAITPDNDNDITYTTRYLYVGTAGHVKVTFADGTTATLNNLIAGTLHPLRVNRVWSTGTTALTIVGLI